MTDGHNILVPDMSPEDAWTQLSENKKAALVDCRTTREWDAIGVPDLSRIDRAMYLVEWRQAPDMAVNSAFAQQMDDATGGEYPETLFFICRSGARSKEAATFMQDILSSKSVNCSCVNVAEGFEGTQTPEIIAARSSGWRNKNLPWATR